MPQRLQAGVPCEGRVPGSRPGRLRGPARVHQDQPARDEEGRAHRTAQSQRKGRFQRRQVITAVVFLAISIMMKRE